MNTTKLSAIQSAKRASNVNAFNFLWDRVSKSIEGFRQGFSVDDRAYRIETIVDRTHTDVTIRTPDGRLVGIKVSGAGDFVTVKQRIVRIHTVGQAKTFSSTGFELVTLFSANSFLKERWAGKLLHSARILDDVCRACGVGYSASNLDECFNALYNGSHPFLRLVLFVHNTQESGLTDEFNAHRTIHGYNAACLSRFWNPDTDFATEVVELALRNCKLLRTRFMNEEGWSVNEEQPIRQQVP